MSLIIKILICLISLLILRFILCLSNLIQIKGYYKTYLEYIKNPSFKFSEKKPQILKLFKDAEIGNFMVPKLKPAGYGQVAKLQLNGFENITNIDGEIVPIIESKFHEAIGVFKHRLIQTINPIFWIEFIFKLPEYIFSYFGLKSDNFIVKIMQVIYWLIGIIIGLEKLKIIELFKNIE